MDTVFFSNIKDYLIVNIDKATTRIRIAVAWFTNAELFEAILRSIDRNVCVELILIDDCINRNEFGLNFGQFIAKGGHLYFSNNKKNMHNKFCIFDANIVITGSYNWTYYAENKNWENIVAIHNENIIKEYNDNFDLIKNQLEEVKEYSHYKFNEIEPITLLNDYNYISEDLALKEKMFGFNYSSYLTSFIESITITKGVTAQIPINPNSQINNPIEPIRTTASLGIRCRINGVGNSTAFMIIKGTKIPCEKSLEFITVYNNQTALECETLLGESSFADKNQTLGKIILKDIPPLPPGQGKMIVTFRISEDKRLHVTAKNVHTGNIVEAYYNNII